MLKNRKEKFDDLAINYDLYRPRYSLIFFKEILHWSKKKNNNLNILDIGSGTGIALENLIKVFSLKNNFYAVDISSNMINIGKKKFPFVKWIKGKAEKLIEKLPNMDIFILAQSFQWMNINLILNLIKVKLNRGGLICILQNNRDYRVNNFLNEYESLLESINSSYNRKYRDISYKNEVDKVFDISEYLYIYISKSWITSLSSDSFLGMINSSTQVDKVKSINKFAFENEINLLIDKYLFNGKLLLNYNTELFIFKF